jgi:penicillin amidase
VRAPQLLQGIDPKLNQCSEILSGWDYQSQVKDAGAAIWAVFQGELIKELLDDELNDEELSFYLAATLAGRSVLDARWQHFTADSKKSVEHALELTCRKIEKKLGEDASKWSWGALHPLTIEHTFASGTGLLDKWNMPTAPYGGSHNTVNQSGYSWHKDKLNATWIASIRVITPMSDPGKATFIYPGGQSGHPGHPHYQSLYKTFLAGEQVPLWFHDEDVKKHAKETLVLVPAIVKQPLNVAKVK